MQNVVLKSIFTGILALSIAAGSLGLVAPGNACCSVWPARFSDTKGWIGEIKVNNEMVHVLAYSNIAQNLAEKDGKTGGNAMFLPIPSKPATMNQKNIFDMKKATRVLRDMQLALDVRSHEPPGEATKDLFHGEMPRIQVFEHGVYTIVLAQHASDIPAALSRVPENKRPAINTKIFSAYEKWYPGWTFALCCFDNKDAQNAEPMVWWYHPQYPKVFFFPALDEHTGDVPNLTATVDVDHFVAASSPQLDKLRKEKPLPQGLGEVFYQDREIPKEVQNVLPKHVVGATLTGKFGNGDFLANAADVRAGKFILRRVLPPGADSSKQQYKFNELIELDTFGKKSQAAAPKQKAPDKRLASRH